jgi:hypothetical protein
MTEYTETADELRRIEEMVEREFQKIEKPVAPEPERVENLWPYFALAAFVAGWL